MKVKFTHLKLMLIFVLSSSALLAQNNFRSSGSGSGNWHDPLSWEEETSPGVWSPASGAPTETAGTITVQSGHTITVAAGFARTADQIVVAAGGTLVINDVLTLNDGTGTDLQINGTLTQISDITGLSTTSVAVDGTYNWNGGTLATPTTIGAAGIANIQTSDKNLNSTLTNNGTINWSATIITFNTGVLNNNSTFNATGNNAIAFGSGLNSFNNNASGTFTKNVGTGTTAFNIPVNNAGTFNINTGTINSASTTGAFTNSGTINFTAGTTLNIAGEVGSAFNAGSVLSGTGALNIQGPTDINLALSVPSTISFSFAAPTFTLGGSGSLTLNGSSSWTAGTLDVPTTVGATGTLGINTTNDLTTTLTNDGTINWTGNDLGLNDGNIVNNGTLNATTDNAIFGDGGTNSITNSATGNFTKSVGSGVTDFRVDASNAGTLNITSGTINISSGATFTNTGTITFNNTIFATGQNSGATSNFNAGTVFTGTATLENRFGSTTNVNVPLTIANATMTTGNIGGTGSLTITNFWDWQATGVAVDVTINSGALAILGGGNAGGRSLSGDLTNNGTIRWTAHPINLNDANLTNNGTINEDDTTGGTAAFIITSGGTTDAFVNAGVLNKLTANTLTVNLGVTTTNSGSIQGIGTYTFTGPITNTGSIRPGGNSSLGILAISPSAITGNSTTVRIEIGTSNTPGTGHDQLNVSNSVDLTNATLIATEPPGDVAPQAAYTIMTAGSGTITGPFATTNIPGGWTITYNPTSVVLTKTTSTLPVSWGEFFALPRNGQVQLYWSTLQEVNTSHFIVEHSTNGMQYTAIGTVTAAGNSSSENSYTFIHQSPDKSKLNYYRLLQVDVDGKKEYSAIRAVRLAREKAVLVQATPNPVRNEMQLSVLADNIRVVLTDLNGRIIINKQFSIGIHPLNIQACSSGVYVLSIYQKEVYIDSQKVIKQ